MAGEKKTLKTRLIQVGSQKFDAPYSLADLIITTDGKTVKEILDEFNVEIGNPKDVDNNIDATGLYKLIEDKTIDTSTLQLKEDNSLITTDKTVVGAIAEIINEYLGSKKLVYLTQAEYDLLSDSDKNDTTKVYNITDAVEKDYQEKEDNTLNTDDKTIVGGINELDTAIGDIKTEIGTKKVEGTPEVLEHYELSDSSNPDALEVVDDSVTPADGQITVTNANLNNSGTPFVAGNYVVHVDAIAEIPETPATGMYKHIDIEIKNALIGGEVDLSGYQEKTSDNLNTVDKTIEGAINELEALAVELTPYTDTEIEAMFDGTTEEIQYYESLIQDSAVSTNRLFSSQETVNRITQALLDSQKYANDLVSGLSMVKAKKVETKPDTGIELTIYLVGNDTDGYHQWMFIEGAWADLGSTNITLNGYITEEKLTEELAKKADNDKVLKLDKITTTMSSTPSNDNVLSELAIKNLLDGKADSTSIPTNVSELTNDSGYITSSDIPSIPTVTNDLTDALKANYDAAYTHSQTTHFDGDYNNLTNKPTIPTPRTDDEIKSLADGQISANMTTTINSSSTDTQIPTAKSVLNTVISGNTVTSADTYGSDILYFPCGIYNIAGNVVAQTLTNLPESVAGILTVTSINPDKSLDVTFCYRSYRYETYLGAVYYRTLNTGSATPPTILKDTKWQKVLVKSDIVVTVDSSGTDEQIPSAKSVYANSVAKALNLNEAIPDNADLNDYLTPGVYSCYSGTNAKTYLNCPTIGSNFKLYVSQNTGGTKSFWGHQIIHATNADGASIFYRAIALSDRENVTDSAYKPWQKVYVTSISDISKTIINTFDDETYVKPNKTNTCDYTVKDGICTLRIETMCLATSANFTKILSGLPKPMIILYENAVNRNISVDTDVRAVFQLSTAGDLYVACNYGDDSVTGARTFYVSFTYKVAEK